MKSIFMMFVLLASFSTVAATYYGKDEKGNRCGLVMADYQDLDNAFSLRVMTPNISSTFSNLKGTQRVSGKSVSYQASKKTTERITDQIMLRFSDLKPTQFTISRNREIKKNTFLGIYRTISGTDSVDSSTCVFN